MTTSLTRLSQTPIPLYRTAEALLQRLVSVGTTFIPLSFLADDDMAEMMSRSSAHSGSTRRTIAHASRGD
jgi:hypothetical protein